MSVNGWVILNGAEEKRINLQMRVQEECALGFADSSVSR